MSGSVDEDRPGHLLFEFVRHWSRRTPESGTAQGRLVMLVEAVQALTERGTPATINAVAHELSIDQSGASRWVAAATERGYLELHASTSDGRSRCATVAPAGNQMLAQARAWQEQAFADLTDGWSVGRRREFERALRELLERSYGRGADR